MPKRRRPTRKHRNGGRQEIRRVPWPGKFEGENACALYPYEVMLNGCDDGCEAYPDGGGSYTLFRGPFGKSELVSGLARECLNGHFPDSPFLNRKERRFIASQAGAILHEGNEGFVTVMWFEKEEKLDNAWTKIEKVFSLFNDDGPMGG